MQGKPHSASYARVSYESGWPKAHHPAAFQASVINNQGGCYPAIAYLEDETGLAEVVVFPDASRRRGSSFGVGEVVPAKGVADLQDGVVVMRWA